MIDLSRVIIQSSCMNGGGVERKSISYFILLLEKPKERSGVLRL
jgi:hypothetical protein